MKTAIQDGDNLVASILDWVDVQSTYMKFELEKMSVDDLIDDAIHHKQMNATLKKIKIEKYFEEGLMMHMDCRMMETIKRNLICNSIKFSHREDNIKISGKVADSDVVISVTDQGIGRTEEIKNELFKFGKIPPRLGTENESGSGFGLNICKKMVENQNGQLEIISQPDKGTTVVMHFLA